MFSSSSMMDPFYRGSRGMSLNEHLERECWERNARMNTNDFYVDHNSLTIKSRRAEEQKRMAEQQNMWFMCNTEPMMSHTMSATMAPPMTSSSVKKAVDTLQKPKKNLKNLIAYYYNRK